jgi:hypothetical protein
VTHLGPPVEFGNLVHGLDADGADVSSESSVEHRAFGHQCPLQSDGRRA